MTENTVQDVMLPDVQSNDSASTRRSALAIPFLYWTAANCWIMWNAYKWTDGMNHR